MELLLTGRNAHFRAHRKQCYDVGLAPNLIRLSIPEVIRLRSSMDSDLEAFSHNPTDGSFAALAVQPTARTKYPNQRFLSY